MDNIWKISRLASKFLSVAEGLQTRRVMTKLDIVAGLEKAYSLIDEDVSNIKQNEQKLRAEQEDPSFPAEAKGQLEQNLKRYLVLSDFLMRDFDRWLDDTISKMKRLATLPDLSDQDFFQALRAEVTKLNNMIKEAKAQLAQEGLRLDTAELYSLAQVRRVFFHQLDAFDRTPTDPATLISSQTNLK